MLTQKPQEPLSLSPDLPITALDWVAETLRSLKEPVFERRVFDIVRYGAVGDGFTDCTEALRYAIADCCASGGGRVLVPPGDWLSGAIHLKSNVEFHLAEGATIKFVQDSRAYLPLVPGRWEGTELFNYSSFIYAFEQENIAITGKGKLDGQADDNHWWNWDELLRECGMAGARHRLHKMNDDNTPVAERVFGEGALLRPNLITLYRCQTVLIESVTLMRSPMWNIHPLESDNVVVRGVTIEARGPNTDGCNPESCSNVLIEDCSFNTGNDCIAIKSGRNNDGRRSMISSKNLIIRRCTFRGGHGGVTLGSEIAAGVFNVFVEDCSMNSSNLCYAFRIKNNARRGGQIEHFYCRHITVAQVFRCVLKIDFQYEEGSEGNHIPIVRNVQLENVKCDGCQCIAEIHGIDSAVIALVGLKDSEFVNVAQHSVIEKASAPVTENVMVNGRSVIAI